MEEYYSESIDIDADFISDLIEFDSIEYSKHIELSTKEISNMFIVELETTPAYRN
jgi:hypothetical protein